MQVGKVAVVVGGCGFLGRHLVEGLVARGYRVRVFDIRTTFTQEGVEFHTGSLCRKEVSTLHLPHVTVWILLYHRTCCRCCEGPM